MAAHAIAGLDVAEQGFEVLDIGRFVREVEVVPLLLKQRNVRSAGGEAGHEGLTLSKGTKLLRAANLGNIGAWCQKRENHVGPIDRLLYLHSPTFSSRQAL
jgi:hypothetical protein